MNFYLENEKLKIAISDRGAELQSIYGKTTDFEYLWQGSKKYWANRATNIFPICGRLFDGIYTYQGKTYSLPCHGFAGKSIFSVEKQTKDNIIFKLSSNSATKENYPFDFNYYVEYTLSGNKLTTKYTVENTGDGDLPFAIGGHPGFNVPLGDGIKFSEHYLEFSEPTKPDYLVIEISDGAVKYLGKTAPYPLKKDKILPIKHSMFDNDALFLSNMAKSVTLKSNKTDRFVKVTYPDMPHVGFWHNPNSRAKFICIEPWDGVPSIYGKIDDFATKPEFNHLDSGKTYVKHFDIEVNE